MKAVRHLGLVAPLVLVACATAVTQDLSDPEDEGGAGTHAVASGGKSTGGKSGSTSNGGSSGSGPKAFGGTATSGGKASGEAGEASGGEASSGTGGSTAGSGGKASGGGGSGGSSAGSGGTGGSAVGTGSCSSTPLFVSGPNTKYAKGEKVVSVCSGGTPCIQAQPPLQAGKSYEFSCLDEFNCGMQDPGMTNWSTPPWSVTKACE